jgi:hypothetical protein
VTWLRNAATKIAGLFVDDPTLAGGIAVWIIAVALAGYMPVLAPVRPYALALGLAAILMLSIVRGATATK